MEEFTAGAAADMVGTSALAVANRSWRWLRLAGRYEPRWLGVGVVGDSLASLTTAQVEDIERFLASRDMRAVLSLLVITQLSPAGTDHDVALAAVRGAYDRLAEKWNVTSSAKWAKFKDTVWEALGDLLSAGMSNVSSSIVPTEEILHFSRFLASPLESDDSSSLSARYLSRLTVLAGDLDALTTATEVSAQLVTVKRSRTSPPILTHTDAEISPDFERLYVRRTINSAVDGTPRASEDIIVRGEPFRIVLTGSPGAGKSTFVSHLATAAAQIDEAPQTAVLIKCRDYMRDASLRSILEYIHDRLVIETDLQPNLEVARNLLLLGRMLVIFDGLDEVTEIVKRTDMVSRIESLAGAYPATSILVTSREIGYHRAPLSERVFDQYRLFEFTKSQVAEYCARWFELVGRQDLQEPFMSESESVSDLRRNPLLLSLLCILFRARGAIPRNRREVYAKCADLLFTRWDAHRGIPQAEDMPRYGNRIMQEIARWVYSSPSAQTGLEERVIAKVIAVHLESTAGVPNEEARIRAEEFLAFCAGRAWLLAKVGTTAKGERIFGFTHRTFFEYFAAEAFSRSSKRVEDVVRHIQESYVADSTSVLPELLIQAYDDKEERGGWAVFEALCRDPNGGRWCELAIRLMDGVLLPEHVRKLGFDLLCSYWTTTHFNLEMFIALLSLNPDARGQFVRDYLRLPGRVDARKLLLHGWAALELSGRDNRFESDWSVEVSKAIELVGGQAEAVQDPAVQNWMALSGYLDPVTIDPSALLLVSSRFGLQLGAIWWAIEADAKGATSTSEHHRQILQAWCDAVDVRQRVAESLLERFVDTVEDHLISRAAAGHETTWQCRLTEARHTLLSLGLAAGECEIYAPEFYWMVSQAVGIDTDSFFAVRRWSVRAGSKPDLRVGQEVVEALDGLPSWVRLWAAGRRALVMQKL